MPRELIKCMNMHDFQMTKKKRLCISFEWGFPPKGIAIEQKILIHIK